MSKKPKYRMKRDVIITEGQKVQVDPPGTVLRTGCEYVSLFIAINRNVTAEFRMALDEAIETGIVEEV